MEEGTKEKIAIPQPQHRNLGVVGLSLLFIFIAGVAYTLHLIMTPPAPNLNKFPIKKDIATETDSTLLFQRTASWGPCALPNPNACHDELTLSQDGVLRVSSVKGPVLEKITPYNLEKIKTHIQASQLLTKPCDAPIVVDNSAHYRITLDGITRGIDFPGCENDLKVIDDILNNV
jgi:hypothetical protein